MKLRENEETKRLLKRLNEVEKALGGRSKAYAIERKTRMFVDEILKSLCERLSSPEYSVYIEMEAELRLFNETIRPDY